MELMSVAFEKLKRGEIISANSQNEEIKTIVYYLSDDESFLQMKNNLNPLGYELIREYDCFYITKKEQLKENEIDKYITKYRQAFLAVAILKHYFPALNSGSPLNKSEVIAKAVSSENVQVKDLLISLSQEKDNLSSSIEHLLKTLRKFKIIEQLDSSNDEKHIVLNSMNYFYGIVKQLEVIDA